MELAALQIVDRVSGISGTVSEGEGSREKTGKAVCERKNKTGETNSTGKEKSEYGKVKKWWKIAEGLLMAVSTWECIDRLFFCYEEIFNCLSEQEKNELLDRKKEFAKAAEIELNITE